MIKSVLYSMLFTVFFWLGGIVPPSPGAWMSGAAAAGPIPVTLAQQGTANGAASQAEAGGQAKEAGAGKSKVMAMDAATFIWELVLFLILLVVLAKFVWPPILKGLQQRESKIRGDLERAEQANREATETLEQYKQQLADAQKQAQQIVEQSREDARKAAAQQREQAQADLQQMRRRAEADIQAAREQAVADLYEQTATLATQVAGQILQREVSPQDDQTLIRRSLDRFAQARR